MSEPVAASVSPTISILLQPSSVCTLDSAAFTIVAAGSATLHYQWTQNDNPVGEDSDTLILDELELSHHDSVIQCEVYSACVSAISDTAVLRLCIPGDADRDLDVDLDDFGFLQACMSGPSVLREKVCEIVDFDRDGDVDQSDFGLMQRCFSGANVPADPDCGI